jgi:excisionase family DNA binding protein
MTNNSTEAFLTIEDLALKLKVSKIWLYKLVRQKRIPFYHIEKCVRFDFQEIREWLNQRHMKEYRRSA